MIGCHCGLSVPDMTTTTHIRGLDHSIERTNIWLAELAAELGTDDRHEAYRVLRAFLHALRDRLTVEEAAELAAQLPILMRGVFFQDWQPSRTPERYRDRDEFLARFAAEADLEGESTVSFAAEAALFTFRRHVSDGEVTDILAVLPEDLRELLLALTVHASS
jgi:uncharacterized protein (DUF2267 family)